MFFESIFLFLEGDYKFISSDFSLVGMSRATSVEAGWFKKFGKERDRQTRVAVWKEFFLINFSVSIICRKLRCELYSILCLI